MKTLCKLFGHRPGEGYYKDDEDGNCSSYFTIKMTQTDGIGRVHAYLHTTCRRCGQDYQVGMLHLPKQKENPCSSADEEHLTTNQKVAGSNPVRGSIQKPMFEQIQDDVCKAVRPVLDKWKNRIKKRKTSNNILVYYVIEGARDAIYKPKEES